MRDVGRLVTGKARRYLRTSTVLFCLALCLVGTSLVLAERSHAQRQGQFVDNTTVHLIRVTGPAVAGNGAYLRFADAERVAATVRDRHPSAGATTTTVYSLGFGVPDADGTPRFVYGLDGDGARLLGVPALRDGVLYSSAGGSGPVVLQVPVVEVEDGGFSSGSAVAHQLTAEGGVPPGSPLDVLGGGDPAAGYVTAATFRTLVQDAYGDDWSTFRTRFDRDNPYGGQVVGDVYVFVPSLDDVQDVAGTLDGAGYATTWTLEAFDDLASSLSSAALLGLAAVLAALLGSLLYVVLSLDAYLRVSHRDMAVLRHAGFSAGQVGRLYGARVVQLFLVVGAVALAWQLALGAWLLPGQALRLIGLNAAASVLLLGLLCAAVLRGVVPRHSRLDVLTLLRVDREFE